MKKILIMTLTALTVFGTSSVYCAEKGTSTVTENNSAASSTTKPTKWGSIKKSAKNKIAAINQKLTIKEGSDFHQTKIGTILKSASKGIQKVLKSASNGIQNVHSSIQEGLGVNEPLDQNAGTIKTIAHYGKKALAVAATPVGVATAVATSPIWIPVMRNRTTTHYTLDTYNPFQSGSDKDPLGGDSVL